jgi:deoxycytidylate deaminase
VDNEEFYNLLKEEFKDVGYEEEKIQAVRVSEKILLPYAKLAQGDSHLKDERKAHLENLLNKYDKAKGDGDRVKQVESLQDIGDLLRARFGPGILAVYAASSLLRKNTDLVETDSRTLKEGRIIVFHRWIRREEIQQLRSVFGERFLVLAIHEPLKSREKRWKDSVGNSPGTQNSAEVQQMLSRHDKDIREAFTEADFFVEHRDEQEFVKDQVQRFVHLLYSDWKIGPTPQEVGMFAAWGASLRSSDLSRQVGAAVMDRNGSLISVGCNEVPSPTGGLYWDQKSRNLYEGTTGISHRDVDDARASREDTGPFLRAEAILGVLGEHYLQDLERLVNLDARLDLLDLVLKVDSDIIKRVQNRGSTLQDFQNLINKATETLTRDIEQVKQWLKSPDRNNRMRGCQELLRKLSPLAREKLLSYAEDTRLKSVLEFGRGVHAEMAALTDAARRGVSVEGATLLVTLFPCHNCARHLVASGIRTVYFIEPYPKSLAPDLHGTEIFLEGEDDDEKGNKVVFRPFLGVAPRFFATAFSPIPKEDKLEKVWEIREWDAKSAPCRLKLRPFYLGALPRAWPDIE